MLILSASKRTTPKSTAVIIIWPIIKVFLCPNILEGIELMKEAKKFIQLVVKPDYKKWVGKEDHEQRFMELVENKFNH